MYIESYHLLLTKIVLLNGRFILCLCYFGRNFFWCILVWIFGSCRTRKGEVNSELYQIKDNSFVLCPLWVEELFFSSSKKSKRTKIWFSLQKCAYVDVVFFFTIIRNFMRNLFVTLSNVGSNFVKFWPATPLVFVVKISEFIFYSKCMFFFCNRGYWSCECWN